MTSKRRRAQFPRLPSAVLPSRIVGDPLTPPAERRPPGEKRNDLTRSGLIDPALPANLPTVGTTPQSRLLYAEHLSSQTSSPTGIAAKVREYLSPTAITHAEWIMHNLPGAFPLPLGPHQRWIEEEFRAQLYGSRIACAANRGSGKSTFTKLGLPLSAIALGTHEFILIVDTTQTQGDTAINTIRDTLESGDLSSKYPRLRYIPKARSTRRNKVETSHQLQLAGGWIVAVGAQGKVRGINRPHAGRVIRPDLAIIDDCEDEKSARSWYRTNQLEEWLFGAVGGLGTSERPVSMLYMGTTLGPDSLMSRAIKHKGRFAPWTTRAFPILSRETRVSGAPIESSFWPERYSLEFIHSLTDKDSPNFVGHLLFSREYMLDPREVSGAMWTEELLTSITNWEDNPPFPFITDPTHPLYNQPDPRWFTKIVVAVDPSWGSKGDECGIVVAGLGPDRHVYILEDRSIRATPETWGKRAAEAFRVWQANYIIAEANFGAEDVHLVMKLVAPDIPYRTISCSRGKRPRFEHIITSFEKELIQFVDPPGQSPYSLRRLINQMLEWQPPNDHGMGGSHFSPDRIDAMAWAIHFLIGKPSTPARLHRAPTAPVDPRGTLNRLSRSGAQILTLPTRRRAG